MPVTFSGIIKKLLLNLLPYVFIIANCQAANLPWFLFISLAFGTEILGRQTFTFVCHLSARLPRYYWASLPNKINYQGQDFISKAKLVEVFSKLHRNLPSALCLSYKIFMMVCTL